MSVEEVIWHRSRFCDTNSCVEVAFVDEYVLMRSSLNPNQIVRFTRKEWADFNNSIING